MRKTSSRLNVKSPGSMPLPVENRLDSAPEVDSPRAHLLERRVRRELLSNPKLKFSSLVIHRIKDGVCLEGVLEANDDNIDVCEFTRGMDGVENVLNHLVLHREPVAKV